MGNTASKIHEWFESQLSFGGIHNINSSSKVNSLIVKMIECIKPNECVIQFQHITFQNTKFKIFRTKHDQCTMQLRQTLPYLFLMTTIPKITR